MPNALDELARLGVAFVIVAAVAVPLALVVWFGAVRNRPSPAPRWRPLPKLAHRPFPTESFDFLFILVFLLVFAGLYPLVVNLAQVVLDRSGFFDWLYGPAPAGMSGAAFDRLKQLWGVAVATVPVVLPLWLGHRWWTRSGRGVFSTARLPRSLAYGVAIWLVVSPVVYIVHVVSSVVSTSLGMPPARHPLTDLGIGSTPFDQVFFAVIVCLCTPLYEEVLFRGWLVGWAGGRRYRPWVLMVLALFLPLLATKYFIAPLAFAVVLAVGLAAVQKGRRVWARFPSRTASAIYSTAALFALAHAGVWPTPIPLFFLGLGLGLVMARTGSVTACVAVHGLFNAVSFVYLLRGGTG